MYFTYLLLIDAGDRCNLNPNVLSEPFITTSWPVISKLLTTVLKPGYVQNLVKVMMYDTLKYLKFTFSSELVPSSKIKEARVSQWKDKSPVM